MSEQSEIMAAIASAMGQVQKVGKQGKNKHDGYDFASIDDFLALVNPICAEAGLIVSMQEANIEDFTRKGKYGDNAWLRVTWEVTVYHKSGQSLPPVLRTVEVLRNGAQAYGSAQSYALKQFLRSLFLIPTGDKDDADLQPTDAGTVMQGNQRQVSSGPPQHAIDTAKQSLFNAADLDALKAIWTELPKPVQHVQAVIDAKDARKAELETAPAPDNADLAGDEIPNFGGGNA